MHIVTFDWADALKSVPTTNLSKTVSRLGDLCRLLLLAVELAEELGDGGLELGVDAAHDGLG